MLLIDQNLPISLAKFLQIHFSGTIHVKDLNGMYFTDSEIWQTAYEKNFAIVSKDRDFYEMMLIKKFPPKLIWVRTGNASSLAILNLFESNLEAIRIFLSDTETGCLELI